MFEGKKKIIRRWFLEIEGEKIEFRYKKEAIRIGRQSMKLKPVKLIETERFWFGKVKSEMEQLSYEEYDRTYLLL